MFYFNFCAKGAFALGEDLLFNPPPYFIFKSYLERVIKIVA